MVFVYFIQNQKKIYTKTAFPALFLVRKQNIYRKKEVKLHEVVFD